MCLPSSKSIRKCSYLSLCEHSPNLFFIRPEVIYMCSYCKPRTRYIFLGIVIVLIAIAVTGCATHNLSQPMPDRQGWFVVKISSEKLSRMTEVALGTYQ